MTHAKQHRASAEQANALLDALDARSAFAFSSARQTMVATGPLVDIERQTPEQVTANLRKLATVGGTNPCLVGCHPFATSPTANTSIPPSRPYLCVAPHVSLTPPMPWFQSQLSVGPREPVSSTYSTRDTRQSDIVPAIDWHIDRKSEQASRDAYRRAVTEVLARIAAREVDKVVLSRVLDLTPRSAHDGSLCRLNATQLASIVRDVLLREPARFGFAVRLPNDLRNEDTIPGHIRARDASSGGTRWLFGASPELLLSKRGAKVESFPLAGSVPRARDPQTDSERAAGLLRSNKDLREHAFVVQAIADTLSPHCRDLQVPRGPQLVSTPTLWHLGTHISGTLHDASLSSYALALLLHPTPAVCGTPTAAARAAIDELEGFPRDYFTGMVGWCDAAGDGEWAVTIRCGEVTPTRMRLYAGAGVVAGSTPEAELTETDAKLRTLLRALHINANAEVV